VVVVVVLLLLLLLVLLVLMSECCCVAAPCPAEPDGVDAKIRRLHSVIQILPPANRHMFHRLVQMLSLVRVALWYCLGDTSESTHDTRSLSLAQVAEHSSVNEMTPTNLAIVFAPIVMRYNTTDLQQLLKLSEWENEVLELCIRHYHIVFEDASSVRANAIAANFEEELRQGGILLAKSLLQKVRPLRPAIAPTRLSLSLSLTIVMRPQHREQQAMAEEQAKIKPAGTKRVLPPVRTTRLSHSLSLII